MTDDLFGKIRHRPKTRPGSIKDPLLQLYGRLPFILHMKDQPQGFFEPVSPVQIREIILYEPDLGGLTVSAVFRVMSKGMF